jgi:hypothetical protein
MGSKQRPRAPGRRTWATERRTRGYGEGRCLSLALIEGGGARRHLRARLPALWRVCMRDVTPWYVDAQALGYYIATDSDPYTKGRLTVGWVQRGEALWQGMAGVAPAVPIRLSAW